MGWSAVVIYHRFAPLTTQFISIKCLTVYPRVAASWSSSVTSYRYLRWILHNVVHSYKLSFLQDWWRGNSSLYITAGHNVLRHAIGSAEVHVHAPFLLVFLFYFGHKQKYTCKNSYTYAYTYTGHMTVILENGSNFKNGIPIPDYQIHLLFYQIPYDL